MLLRMQVKGLTIDPLHNSPVLILRSEETGQDLQIWIGANEALAISNELESVTPQRPLTHDLLRNILEELGVKVTRVIITELRNDTFFALIELNHNGNPHEIDCRPSDAVAVALRAGAEILVESTVLDMVNGERNASPSKPEKEQNSWDNVDDLKNWLDRISPEDFGQE